MADTAEKRRREAMKRRKREIKAERKQLRKDGLLGQDSTGLFPPGVKHPEIIEWRPAGQPTDQPAAPSGEAQPDAPQQDTEKES